MSDATAPPGEPSELTRLRERVAELEVQLAAADAAGRATGPATASPGGRDHHRCH